MQQKWFSYPSAFVKTHIYDAFEENEIGFWEFKGLELGSKQISIFGQEVLKQHWIHSASEIKQKVDECRPSIKWTITLKL